MERVWWVLLALVALLILVILAGAAIFHYVLEVDWDEAFYNCFIIFTTVQVELTPRNPWEKFLISAFTLVSVVIFLLLISILAGYILKWACG